MAKPIKRQSDFSGELHTWLKDGRDKTLGGLNDVFAEKTFAIAFLLLMALPALPIPTGGLTHLTEIIAMLLALELIAGRKSVWLPKRWLKVDVGKALSGKAAGKLIGFIGWFERRSRQRWNGAMVRTPVPSVIGFIVLTFTVAAFVAPPFSGLDTLPALGVVIISLGLILEDGLLLIMGILVGILGIGLEIVADTAAYNGIKHLLQYV
ncbi:MAG TPA: exopolysaccharide biosynthesis protein [Candidatus Saccharimonadales bacterium]|nr:exopolysaccharide biosynthesis protein [Candidatus Saccharimonadales bacterium]